MITKQQALDYHFGARPGKIEVTPIKPCRTQRDLSLAYTPGVAEPCLEIEKNPIKRSNAETSLLASLATKYLTNEMAGVFHFWDCEPRVDLLAVAASGDHTGGLENG